MTRSRRPTARLVCGPRARRAASTSPACRPPTRRARYRGKIVHKGKVYEGEHEAIVDEDLWERVQMHLAEKAPPRRRPTNDKQNALLRGLITDPQGRPMVPTYGSSKVKRYTYYETRKDLARPGDPPGLRFQRGKLEQHLISELAELLGDQHRLRRMTGLEDAGALRTLFATAHLVSLQLGQRQQTEVAIRSLVKAITIGNRVIELQLDPSALGIEDNEVQHCSIPLPERKPFREAKLRIDAEPTSVASSTDLIELLGDAMATQRLVLASPQLTLNQLAKREGRCRTQLARLLRISFLSPRIVEAITEGSQPKGLNRRVLLSCDLPIDWADQERLFGLAS